MAWDINRVTLVGRLSSDVDLRYTQSGVAIAKFGLAVGGRPRQQDPDPVSFFNVVVWGKSGENCSKYLSKGKQIALDGRLEQSRWKAQDGSNRSRVEIYADRGEFLGSPSSGSNQERQGGSYQGNQGPSDSGPIDDKIYDNTDFDPTPLDYKNDDNDVPF